MKRRGLQLLTVSLLAGALLAACSDSNAPLGRPHGVGKSWVGAEPGQAAAHGTSYQTAKLDCAQCHDMESYCGSRCHFDPGQSDVRVPPESGWQHRAPPPSHGFLEKYGDVCLTCHRILRGYDQGPGSCHDCHGRPEASHPLGQPWLDSASADFHGNSSLTCAECHDANTFCYQCHFGPGGSKVPAGAAWVHGTSPHPGLEASSTVCQACHELTRQFRNEPAACHDCHASHVAGQPWLDPASPAFHGSAVDEECFTCHTAETFCSTCHFGSSGSKVPPGVTGWDHAQTLRYPHARDDLSAQEAVCKKCHELMKGFSGQPSHLDCANCHGNQKPHPDGNVYRDGHKTTTGKDLLACQKCHGQPGTQSFSGGVAPQPLCSSCHTEARAHPVPWIATSGAGTNHYKAANIPAACAICHKVDGLGQGPLAGAPSCFSASVGAQGCHADGFGGHTMPFKDPSLHGAPAKADLVVCQKCHADSPTGGPGSNPRFNAPKTGIVGTGLTKGCEDCHPAGSAHATSWQGQNGNKRSHRNAGNVPAACSICHGADLKGSAGPSCSSGAFTNAGGSATACHANGYGNLRPFHTATTWMANHEGIAQSGSNSTCTAECHQATGTTTVNGIPGCGVCHFGPTGSRVPAGVAWTHGTIPHDSLVPYAAVCDKCHSIETSLDVTCTTTCHVGGHATGQPWLDKKGSTFHGISAKANVASCAPCHGSDYRGGTAGVSCYTCHFSPQGNKSPTGLQHVNEAPAAHSAYGAYQLVCNSCHNTNRRFGNQPATCHDCHVQQHPVGQPWLDKKVSTYHGAAAKQTLASCAACHGADYRGGTVGVSCYTCHFGPQGNKSPTGAAHVGTSEEVHQTFVQYASICNACHQTNRKYGNASPSVTCFDCHEND